MRPVPSPFDRLFLGNILTSKRMWERLMAGKISNVSTDHAPWPADRKASADIFECSAVLTGCKASCR